MRFFHLTQMVLRMICIVFMLAMIIILVKFHSFCLSWYEWIVFSVICIGTITSIIIEFRYKCLYKRYFLYAMWTDWVFFSRAINLGISIILFWYTIQSKSFLGDYYGLILISEVIIGLFTVFNFYYWIMSLVILLATLFIWEHLQSNIIWMYCAISVIIIIGLIFMMIFSYLLAIYRCYKKLEISHEQLSEKHKNLERNLQSLRNKYREINEENQFLLEQYAESLQKENKWWKFW